MPYWKAFTYYMWLVVRTERETSDSLSDHIRRERSQFESIGRDPEKISIQCIAYNSKGEAPAHVNPPVGCSLCFRRFMTITECAGPLRP